jgi:hypothetical protein
MEVTMQYWIVCATPLLIAIWWAPPAHSDDTHYDASCPDLIIVDNTGYYEIGLHKTNGPTAYIVQDQRRRCNLWLLLRVSVGCHLPRQRLNVNRQPSLRLPNVEPAQLRLVRRHAEAASRSNTSTRCSTTGNTQGHGEALGRSLPIHDCNSNTTGPFSEN